MGLPLAPSQAVARGVGGISGAVNFVWEIARFKLAAKFPKQSPGASAVAKVIRACKALHTATFLGVSPKFPTHNPEGSAKFLAAKFTTANLTWPEIPPTTPEDGCLRRTVLHAPSESARPKLPSPVPMPRATTGHPEPLTRTRTGNTEACRGCRGCPAQLPPPHARQARQGGGGHKGVRGRWGSPPTEGEGSGKRQG